VLEIKDVICKHSSPEGHFVELKVGSQTFRTTLSDHDENPSWEGEFFIFELPKDPEDQQLELAVAEEELSMKRTVYHHSKVTIKASDPAWPRKGEDLKETSIDITGYDKKGKVVSPARLLLGLAKDADQAKEWLEEKADARRKAFLFDRTTLSAEERAFFEAARDNKVEKLRELLPKIESINLACPPSARIPDVKDYRTPLHVAAMQGHVAVVAFLLENGANPNLFFRNGGGGLTALHEAAQKGHLGVVKLLLEADANANIWSNANKTAAQTGQPFSWGKALGELIAEFA